MLNHINKVTSLRALKVTRQKMIVAVLGLCLSYAETVSAEQTITLAWALDQTLQHNSELKAYPYQLQMMDAYKIQAGLTPNPTVGLNIENAFGDGNRTGLSQSEITLTLGQTIELGDKRQHRLALTDAKSANQIAEFTITRLNVLAETSRRYYEVLYLQSLATLMADRVKQESDALSVIQRRANAGSVGKADVSKMALRLAESKLLLQQLHAQHRLAKTRLATMWLAESEFDRVAGDLNQWPALPDMAALEVVIKQTPTWLLHQAKQHMIDRQLQLAKSNGISDVNFGIGFRRFEGTDDQALTLSLSMPLSLTNPNQGNIAAAEIERRQLEQQREFVMAETALSLKLIQQQLKVDSQYVNDISERLLPYANTLLSETQKGYRNGNYSVIQWVDAQTELFRLKQKRLETQMAIFLQLLELERITGQSLTTLSPSNHSLGNTHHE